jgi:hypothetical protein
MQPATRFPSFVFLAATLSLLWIAGCETPKTAKPPNIVILTSDNHSWNHLGSYGDPVVRTPTIDRVAGEGIRFTVMGRERHAFVRANGLGYPGRAIRTHKFLYVRKYEPDRWRWRSKSATAT